jgi:hypothetical protein
MPRIIQPTGKVHSEQVSPGVWLERFYPGGKAGPHGEVLSALPGGQGWTEAFVLGGAADPFQMLVPDIRLPANQFWPLHWHDCWTAVLILEGQCLIGDWWMHPGDVFITEPALEYGPLLIGPQGCRLFEIFAKAHLSLGGYAPEYRDHPTLQGTRAVFLKRSPLNKRNEGRQTLPCDGVKGITKGKLAPGARWDLGESSDPDRGVLQDTRLSPGERLPAAAYADWHALLVLDGTLQVAGRTLQRDDRLVVRPGEAVNEIEAGPEGAHWLELARTARGMTAKREGV